jgi:hypothetical protein
MKDTPQPGSAKSIHLWLQRGRGKLGNTQLGCRHEHESPRAFKPAWRAACTCARRLLGFLLQVSSSIQLQIALRILRYPLPQKDLGSKEIQPIKQQRISKYFVVQVGNPKMWCSNCTSLACTNCKFQFNRGRVWVLSKLQSTKGQAVNWAFFRIRNKIL